MAREASGGGKPQSDFQVFLSFRGCDTRQGFTDCLYHFLIDAGVRVFRDNEELRPGEKIKEVLTAINRSIVCIPILSENYANSKWCLLELAKMVELKKDIMPIFYKVTADDVKLKTKLYSNHLSTFGKEYDADKEEWERALKEVGGIFGKSQLEGTFKEVGRTKAWTIMDYPGYAELCKEVVLEVLHKLEVKHKIFEGPLIGIDEQVETIKRQLDIGSPDVRYIVIHGVGGVGKTTLAKFIFNQLYDSQGGFQRCCFLDNVRETANSHGIVYLQNKLLKELGQKITEIRDIDSGIKTIKNIVNNKKVLIILDDLDQRKQIESLAGDSIWFDSGSRIIITTKDPTCVVKHPKILYYNMSGMSSRYALRLFCRHAFKMESPPAEYLDISKEVVAACGRLPLALEVMGSYLYHIDRENWKSKIEMLVSHIDIQEKLIISFNTLNSRTKEIFLDIACFFVGRCVRHAKYMWEACDFRPDEGVQHLLSMSLVKISEDNTFMMHDLLRDLGREIVIHENLKRPERRSRLWSRKEVERILSREKGTNETDALRLIYDDDAGCESRSVTPNQIKPLQNLRYLELGEAYLEGDFRGTLQDLKWLSWHNPKDLNATNLLLKDIVILDLTSGVFSNEWLGTIEVGQNLKVLKLSNYTTFIPRDPFCWAGESSKLAELMEKLSSLVELEISHCQLEEMPSSVRNLKNLRVMNLNYSDIEELPSSIGDLEKLEELHVACSWLKHIPEDIGRLHQLRILDVSRSEIHHLPSTMDKLPLLQHLRLEECNQIQELPNLPSSLTILHVSSKSLRKLPNLSNLRCLNDLLLSGDLHMLSLLEKHSNVNCINSCHSLETFELTFRSITHIDMETGAFPHLKQLRLCCPDLQFIGHLPLSLTKLHLSAIIAEIELPACLRKMEALNYLELSQCKFIGEFLLPIHLKTLCINRCSLPQPSVDLSGLKMLRHLVITNCKELVAVRGVECMEFLEKVTVFGCRSMKEISDLSKFERLAVTTDDVGLFRDIEDIIDMDLILNYDKPREVDLEGIDAECLLDLLFDYDES